VAGRIGDRAVMEETREGRFIANDLYLTRRAMGLACSAYNRA